MRNLRIYFWIIILGFLIIPINGSGQDITPKTHEITIRNFAFSPSILQIDIGDKVVFKWDNSAFGHNVEQVGNSKDASYDSGFRSGNPQDGPAEWILPGTFTQENATLYYMCGPHVFSNNMRGKIIVGAGSDESESGGSLGLIIGIVVGTGIFTIAVIVYLQNRKKSV